jgi:ABC-type ATPase with predicted acetyltransferase domain
MSDRKNTQSTSPVGVALTSERARTVARWFGIAEASASHPQTIDQPPPTLKLAPGTITLITGASGAGKSTLLRQIQRSRKASWIDVDRISLPQRMVVDCFENEDLEKVLTILGRVGLGEVWTYLRKPSQLSEGQRWRLRWAIALWRAARDATGKSQKIIVASDEFCSVLDPVTARVVSRCLRRTISQFPTVAAVVASARDDLVPALQPDATVACDFGTTTVTEK